MHFNHITYLLRETHALIKCDLRTFRLSFAIVRYYGGEKENPARHSPDFLAGGFPFYGGYVSSWLGSEMETINGARLIYSGSGFAMLG